MSSDEAATTYPDPDLRPVVRTAPAGNRTLWIFGAIMAIAVLFLFEALSTRREMLTAPATQAVPSNGGLVTAPPPLTLPSQFREVREPELTGREREVLALVAAGMPNKRIAMRLEISEKTVKAHLTRVYERIGVSDRTQAALWAPEHGIEA